MRWVFKFFIFSFLQLLLISLQTSFWLQVFGEFPSPQFWIPALTYWCLNRSPLENILFIYISVILLGSFTALQLSLLLLILVIIFWVLYYLKSRIYWSGPTFHMLACGLATLMFPVAHIMCSWALEPNPVRDPEIFYWIVSTLTTMLVALPLYRLFTWIDTLLKPVDGLNSREGFL